MWLGEHSQGQKVTRPLCSPPCWRIRWLQRWAWERVGHGKLLLRCCLLGGARRFGAHRGRREAGAYRGGRPPTTCFVLNQISLDASAMHQPCQLVQQTENLPMMWGHIKYEIQSQSVQRYWACLEACPHVSTTWAHTFTIHTTRKTRSRKTQIILSLICKNCSCEGSEIFCSSSKKFQCRPHSQLPTSTLSTYLPLRKHSRQSMIGTRGQARAN